MTVGNVEVNLSYEELKALCAERESMLYVLRQQLRAVETQRDQALHGLELLTQALRRRGCCDHEPADASL